MTDERQLNDLEKKNFKMFSLSPVSVGPDWLEIEAWVQINVSSSPGLADENFRVAKLGAKKLQFDFESDNVIFSGGNDKNLDFPPKIKNAYKWFMNGANW